MHTNNHSDSTDGPGPFKSIFIHLAGADPKIFRHLPSNEATEFAKMGFTLLIPFVLALSAGSFTIFTVQQDKNLGLALCFGVVWAIMVLGIDVAIMSQLVKRVTPPALASSGPKRAYGGQTAATEPRIKPTGGIKRFFLAIIRISIAATLGALMSHCIVLAIFKGKVRNQMEETRGQRRSEVKEKFNASFTSVNKALADIRSVQGIPSDDEFLRAFRAYNDSHSEKIKTEGQEKIPTSSLPPEFAALLDTHDKILAEVEKTITPLRERKALMEKEVDDMKKELLKAEEMMRDERDGVANKVYTFLTDAFKATMPSSTSGKQGAGSRVDGITKAIADGKKLIAERESVLTKAAEELKVAEERARAAQTAKEGALSDLVASGQQKFKENYEALKNQEKSQAAQSRGQVDELVSRLKSDAEALRTEYELEMKPVSGESYDLMEQTDALHDLANGRNRTGTKQATVMTLIILLLVCLMLIDITPLMIKMMRSPGAYEIALSSLEQQALLRATGEDLTQQHPGGQPGAAGLPPQQAQPTPGSRFRTPPPPPR